MAFLDNIDYDNTMARRRLVLKTKWLDIVDSIVFFLTGAFFLICLYLIYKEADLTSPNDRFIAYGMVPMAGVFTLVLLYKKATEKRLLTIKTPLNNKETRQVVKEAFRSWGWTLHVDNARYIQATTGFEFTWGKQVTVLFGKEELYLNVMSDNPKVRMPVLLSDLSIKSDIKKLLKTHTQQQSGAEALSIADKTHP